VFPTISKEPDQIRVIHISRKATVSDLKEKISRSLTATVSRDQINLFIIADEDAYPKLKLQAKYGRIGLPRESTQLEDKTLIEDVTFTTETLLLIETLHEGREERVTVKTDEFCHSCKRPDPHNVCRQCNVAFFCD
jgi:hypothetical protein